MTVDRDDHQNEDLRSFGRRRGRKRSARQDALFSDGVRRWGMDQRHPAPQPLSELFASKDVAAAADIQSVWLEIGFGGSEHLIWQATHHPDVGFIGAEPFEDGVVKAFTAIAEQGLTNIRVEAGDVRPLLRWLPEASIERAFILFPDPWPKKRHAKRRLVNPSLLQALHRVMAEGARLRIATDIAAYAVDVLAALQSEPHFTWLAKRPDDWRQRPSDWPQTRYELKARQAGRRPYFFEFKHCRTEKT
jgi:tRNA (guanine-N7-)-methyltransferase